MYFAFVSRVPVRHLKLSQINLFITEYYQVVVNALLEKTGNEDCINQLKLAHQQIDMMMKVHPEVIEKEFRYNYLFT